MWPSEHETIEHSAAQEQTIRELRAELQRVNDRLVRVRAELATGHEIVAQILSPQFDSAAYYDSVMDSAREWLQRTR